MASALYSAIHKDLPDVEYTYREPPVRDKNGNRSTERKEEKRYRRPVADRVNVIQFYQTWGSTALGFGGVGMASISTADTTIVESEDRWVAVYFAGRFA